MNVKIGSGAVKTALASAKPAVPGMGMMNWKTASASPAAKKPTMESVRTQWCPRKLQHRCEQTIQEIFQEIGGIVGEAGDQYAFRDNGSKILAVAHCDTVQGISRHFSVARGDHGDIVFSPQLDDRLGVYTILDLLPSLGINVDVLLTENEERGQSTAAHFVTSKKYNWIVEFDRRGSGAVVYDYENAEAWAHEFFGLDYGTFSDISCLQHLGCIGINVGVGYHHEHTDWCHMKVNEYIEQMARFVEMWSAKKDIHVEHQEYTWTPSTYNRDYISTALPANSFDDIESQRMIETGICPYCSTVLIGKTYCSTCGYDWAEDVMDIECMDEINKEERLY